MSNPNPIVTFRQINQAFNSNEAVMDQAHAEADARTKDPIEAASKLAALGNALKVLRQDGSFARCRGRGAGRWPTAESLLADLSELAAGRLALRVA